jgi:phage gp29-like protein
VPSLQDRLRAILRLEARARATAAPAATVPAATVPAAAPPPPPSAPAGARGLSGGAVQILSRDIAAAASRSGRSIITTAQADGLTPERLAILLRNAEAGDAIAFLELAEEMEERDLHYLGVLGTRKRQVSQLPITVVAASDAPEHVAHADFIRAWLDRPTLEAELFDILDAVGKGVSFTEILWDTGGERWLPRALKRRDPRFFEWDRETGEIPLLRGGADGQAGGLGAPLPPFKFITHLHPAKSGLPVRAGLARPVAWAFMAKSFSLSDWSAFAEVYGWPFRLGRYDPGTSADDIATLMRAVAGMGVDAAAVFPKSMEIELVNGQTSGSAEVYERLVQLLDRQVSKAVLGQTATTDADTGGLGSGKEHGEVRADIERADAKLLAASLQQQLVIPMIAFNFGTQRAYPSLRIGQEEQVDRAEEASILAQLVPLGLEVEMSVVRDRLGYPDPPAGAVVLRAAPPPENRPFQGLPAPGGPMMPASTVSPLLGGSYRLQSACPSHGAGANPRGALLAAAAAIAGALEQDQIDTAVAALLAGETQAPDARALLAPIVEPLVEALAAGASFEEAAAILDGAGRDTGDEALAAALERAVMAARLAGQHNG